MEDSLRSAKEILDFVDKFEWRYGEKLVHYRTGNAGLQGQWLEAWWPSSDHEFAFVVEDDLEVSPLYYWFLERVTTTMMLLMSTLLSMELRFRDHGSFQVPFSCL